MKFFRDDNVEVVKRYKSKFILISHLKYNFLCKIDELCRIRYLTLKLIQKCIHISIKRVKVSLLRSKMHFWNANLVHILYFDATIQNFSFVSIFDHY